MKKYFMAVLLSIFCSTGYALENVLVPINPIKPAAHKKIEKLMDLQYNSLINKIEKKPVTLTVKIMKGGKMISSFTGVTMDGVPVLSEISTERSYICTEKSALLKKGEHTVLFADSVKDGVFIKMMPEIEKNKTINIQVELAVLDLVSMKTQATCDDVESKPKLENMKIAVTMIAKNNQESVLTVGPMVFVDNVLKPLYTIQLTAHF